MSELGPQIDVNVQSFNRRLEEAHRSQLQEAELVELILQSSELKYLLIHAGGHMLTASAVSSKSPDQRSMTVSIKHPKENLALPQAVAEDLSQRITFIGEAGPLKNHTILLKFMKEAHKDGFTSITIAVTRLVAQGSGEESDS
jgi:hypothetical protein